MPTNRPYPPFDPTLAAALSALDLPATLTADMIPILREGMVAEKPIETVLSEWNLVRDEYEATSFDGAPVQLSVIRRADGKTSGIGLYHLHGGGMVFGDRFSGVEFFADWVIEHEAVLVTAEYRLAPEYPDPVPVEDCYAGLAWMADNAETLGIAADQIVVVGISAGGGLAAGTALLARDRQGPTLFGQVLMCPMIDDRNDTVSSLQIDGVGIWDRGSNHMGWTALLGERRATQEVSIYAAPSRATDLGNLPPTFLDCGSSEVFRDETIAYAQRIWEAGGSAELHVWSGGFHGFEDFAPDAAISRAAKAARDDWMRRLVAG